MTLAVLCSGESRPSLVLWPVTDVFHLKHAVVFCAFEIIHLFPVVSFVSRDVSKFDSRLLLNEIPNQ